MPEPFIFSTILNNQESAYECVCGLGVSLAPLSPVPLLLKKPTASVLRPVFVPPTEKV